MRQTVRGFLDRKVIQSVEVYQQAHAAIVAAQAICRSLSRRMRADIEPVTAR
jgi:hypothetical protein